MNGQRVSTVNAYTAHREWARRPPDERYASVQQLFDAAEPFLRTLPALAPDGVLFGPGEPQVARAAVPPGSEPVTNSAK